MKRLKVATVITRMAAGAGGVALRGALALDADRYAITIITGSVGLTGDAATAVPHAAAGSGGTAGALAAVGTGAAARRAAAGPVAAAQPGVKAGAWPDVLAGTDALHGVPVGDLLAQAYAAGLDVARVGSLVPQVSPSRDRAALHTLTRLYTEGGYDVVHTHSAKAGALGRAAALRAGVPRIVHTLHGFPFHEFQPTWRRSAYIGIERWLARRTHVLLAVGSGVAAEAIRLGIALPDQIRTIPPAIDPPGQPVGLAARGRARRRLALPTGVRLVGTVGRIDYQKAPEQWIDALAEVGGEDVWGVWIGDGPLRGELLARAAKRGVAERFLLLGQRDDVAELLPALDVFALASRYEGLPCALVEAMAAGVPVVATAVNSVPDLVVPGETGLLVPAGSPRLLGRAIGYLLDRPAEARRMAEAGLAQLGNRYAPQALGVVLDRIYRNQSW